MKQPFLLSFFFLVLISCHQTTTTDFAQYVDPLIGTGGHGHTFPGATVPFGMVQLSPDTRVDGSWDGCSGYHYSDSLIYGFSHTHLSGTGVSDYGDLLLMPVLAGTGFSQDDYRTAFQHENENASAGFYEVRLDNGIHVALTTTTRDNI
jgi:putative alpha-1,2-mannosidase